MSEVKNKMEDTVVDSKDVIFQNAIFKPYEDDKPYIFISYAHEDAEIVFKIMSEMNKRGYRIWYDNGNCFGDVLANVIAKKILNCDTLFCFLSQAYETSDYCMRELEYAIIQKKKIVPIKIEDYELAPMTEFKLMGLYITNLWKYPSEIKLVDHLCKVKKETVKNIHCPVCGKVIEDGRMLCPNCGTPLERSGIFDLDKEWQGSTLEKPHFEVHDFNKYPASDGFEKYPEPNAAPGIWNALPMLVAVLLSIALAVVLWKMR